jgi:ABC-type nitrate/sulfonate/bicarbonate transport system substrate-binding protein
MTRARRQTRWLAATVLAALAAVTACRGNGGASSSEPYRVRAVVMPYLTFMPFHIARAEGLFGAQNLDVEFVRLERMQELMSGLARGDVDVAGGMLTVNVINTITLGGRMRIVGAMGHIGWPRAGSTPKARQSGTWRSSRRPPV